MYTLPKPENTRDRQMRKLLVTLAVSAPVLFWIVGLLGLRVIGKEKAHV